MTLLYLCFLLQFACLFQVKALQPGRASYEGSYETDVGEDHADPFKTKTKIECEDRLPSRRCQSEKNRKGGLGCLDARMQLMCPRTCHQCHKKALSPPKNEDCKETTYGCCWDGKTVQHGYRGEGCPSCADNEVYAALCQIWKKHCHNTTSKVEHEVVKKNCHRTCNICYVPRATSKTTEAQTLPPVEGEYSNSDDVPRRGAIYVWTKLLNSYGFN